MKKYVLSIIFFAISILYSHAQLYPINGKIEGNFKPCPNKNESYTLTLKDGPQDATIGVFLTSGKFEDGSNYKEFKLSKSTVKVNVLWNENSGMGKISFECPKLFLGSMNNDIYIQTLNHHMVPSIIKSKGNGTITSNQQIIEPPILPGIGGGTYGKTTVEIPKGQTGSCVLKASLSYPGLFNKVTKFKWVVNGKEVTTNTSDTYELKHDELDNNGTTIVVTGLNSLCGTSLVTSSHRTITISRKGIDGKDVESVSGNITSSKFIKAKSTVNITNTTISNNVNVTVIAGREIVIKPNSHFAQGANIRVWATGDSSTTKSIVYANEEEVENVEFDTSYYESYYEGPLLIAGNLPLSIEENLLSESCDILLYPNPTEGVLTFDCPDVQTSCQINVYNMAGGVIYTNNELYSGDSIDLSSHPKGMYLARIAIAGEVKTQKIILK